MPRPPEASPPRRSTGLVVGGALALLLLLVVVVAAVLLLVPLPWGAPGDGPRAAAPADVPAAPVRDPASARPLATVELAGNRVPVNTVRASRDGTRVYALSGDALYVVDTASNTVSVKIALPGAPRDLAQSPDGRMLYVLTLTGFLSVIDAGTGQQVSSIPLGGGLGVLGQVAVAAGGRLAYVADIEGGTVTVVDIAEGRVLTTIPVGAEPEAIAATPDGSRVLVGVEGGVAVIDTAGNAVLSTIGLDTDPGSLGFARSPTSISVAPTGRQAYVSGHDVVHVLDVAAGAKLGEIRLPAFARDVALSPDGRYLYASAPGSAEHEVVVVDTTNAFLVGRISVERPPDELGVAADGGRLYVSTRDYELLLVLDLG